MANAFVNTDLVTKFAIKHLLNSLQMAAKVDRQAETQFKKVGDTINLRRAVMFTAKDGAVISSTDDIEDANLSLQLAFRKNVNFIVSTQDMTLEVEAFSDRYVKPAMQELAQQVESSIADLYKEIYNFVGTPGSTPSSFLDVGAAKQILDELGVPMAENRSAFYDPEAAINLANSLKAVFPQQIAERAIEAAMITRYAGFEIFENQSLKAHTVGVNTGTPLVDGADQEVDYADVKNTWTQSLVTNGWTNDTAGILLEGDVFTIAGVNAVNVRTRESTGNLQNFVVRADAAAGASTGPATLTISPPIIITGPYQTVDAAPANDAVITVKTGTGGTQHRQNLAFNRNAITLATAPLDMPMGNVDASQETFDNVSIRTVVDYDFTNDNNQYRFDILYGLRVQNHQYAVRTTG